MSFNLEYYRHFYYVAKFKSITKAADALCVTQPAVTYAIKNLENNLGVSLFNRTNKGMVLTHEGKVLIGQIAQAYNFLIEGENKILAMKQGKSGELKIGATETALYNCLLPILGEYRREFPLVKLHVTGSNTIDLCKNMVNGDVDIAFFVGPLPENISFEVRYIKSFYDILIVSTQVYPEFLAKHVYTLSDINKYPLICVEKNTAARKHLDQWFVNNGLELIPEYSVRTSSLVLPFVKAGLGIGIIPEFFAHDENLTIIPLNTNIPSRKIFIGINKDKIKSVISYSFIDFVYQCLESNVI